MADEPSERIALRRRIECGDEATLLELYARHRPRLRRMVKLRLDRRLQGRLDPSDVLQEAYLDVARRAREYLADPAMPTLPAMLLGRLTSPTRALLRAELRRRLQDALNAMEPIDREVLRLRHFEELNNHETAQILGISRTAASNRYVRALKRLKEVLAGLGGFFD